MALMIAPPCSSRSRARIRRARGFTLAELLLAIAITGVLASLAVVGYRQYFDAARISEPLATLQAIRGSQEVFRRETGQYLNVSTSNTYYPMNSNFGKVRVAWDFPSHSDYSKWKTLKVEADGPMRYGYKTNAGRMGQQIVTPIEYAPVPPFTNPPTEDWYVVQAKGDPNENSKPTVLLTFSFYPEVFIHEDQ